MEIKKSKKNLFPHDHQLKITIYLVLQIGNKYSDYRNNLAANRSKFVSQKFIL